MTAPSFFNILFLYCVLTLFCYQLCPHIILSFILSLYHCFLYHVHIPPSPLLCSCNIVPFTMSFIVPLYHCVLYSFLISYLVSFCHWIIVSFILFSYLFVFYLFLLPFNFTSCVYSIVSFIMFLYPHIFLLYPFIFLSFYVFFYHGFLYNFLI